MDVLIVEDVEAMQQLLKLVLDGIPGVCVSGLARNGWEARLELSRRRPELILLDEILPGESSADLLNDFAVQGIPVILLTSLAQPTHAVRAPALGRLLKPGWRSVEQDRARLAGGLKTLLAATALQIP